MVLERNIALTQSFCLDFRKSGVNVTFNTNPRGPLDLPLDYALLGPDGAEWTRFERHRLEHLPQHPFVWQWLPEDPSKFVPGSYLWIWPEGVKKKAFTLRFRNSDPHQVELHSGYPGLKHTVGVDGNVLVVRAEAEAPFY